MVIQFLKEIYFSLKNIYAFIFRNSLYKKYIKEQRFVVLDEKHLSNCKILVDRIALLKLLPKNACVAEIGIANGDFSESIINICKPNKLYLIDYFGTSRYGINSKNYVEQRFKKHISSNKVILKIGLSVDEISKFNDNFFDWVYLDTDHTYNTTKLELELLLKKMKTGGIICGHDFSMFNHIGDMRYGVIEAVREFLIDHSWEILFLTSEPLHDCSFAIRKI